MNQKRIALLFAVLLIGACVAYSELKFDQQYGEPMPVQRMVDTLPTSHVDYWQDVKPIIESRCVVCHGCYDAPCQLKLSSIEGIERGATQAIVYDQTRITSAPPTRLFEDAQTVADWRKKDFYPVLNEHPDSAEANRMASVMHRILTLKEEHPQPSGALLPDDFDFDINRKHVCAAPATFDKFVDDHPLWGMPYALPAVEPEQQATLLNWLEQGATYTPRLPLDPGIAEAVARWEQFLNGDSLKAQLAARYIYEHLFLTHMYFPAFDERSFFSLVRSSTPPGQPIEVIATRRPYDDPGRARVYYRLAREVATVVSKTHMPYALTPERMANWQAWFMDAEYRVDSLPPYDPATASNPFRSFDDLPVRSRYRFLLDEARNTINAFIKGPVCRGQVALDVINDRFWVFFVNPNDPKLDYLTGFLAERLEATQLPASNENIYNPVTHWRRYAKQQKELVAAWDDYLSEHYSSPADISLDIVWDGDGRNDNAALTIFRHINSATVEKGLIGKPPKTAWLIDYTLLERIHYLLVAGYDVYGNVGHQLLTRVYMDFLRMEGETGFLLLLPEEARNRERRYWYREAENETMDFMVLPRFESEMKPAIDYTSNDPKNELFGMLRERLAPVLSDRFDLASVGDDRIKQQLAPLADLKGGPVTLLPQIVFLEIRGARDSRYVTLLRNNAHLNITSMLREDKYRVPAEDTVTVVTGFLGAYPNAFWSVDAGELEDFVVKLSSLQNEADYRALVDDVGIRRTNPHFWQYGDAFHAAYEIREPVEYGLFDFSRIENR